MTAYVYIDVSRKQEYIFRYKELKNNLIASSIIKIVTEDLKEAKNTAKSFPLTLNHFLDKHYAKQYSFQFSGGGNSILSFLDESIAQDFVKSYSAEVIRHYPELELYMSIVDNTSMEADGLQEMKLRSLLHKKADQYKGARRAAFRRWSYGIEKIDNSGKAELRQGNNDYGIIARDVLWKQFNNIEASLAQKTKELIDYKKGNEKSYIGVIAIDGNRMGEMVNKLNNFEQLREFSKTMEDIYLQAVTNALLQHGKQKQVTSPNKPLLYTPIVQAGDDICLIVEGAYAISLGGAIIENIHQISKQDSYKKKLESFSIYEPLTACAGISIVKYSYPFFDAVKAAEALCGRAKETMHKTLQSEDGSPSACFIDWEIVEGQFMAQQDYTKHAKRLNHYEYFHIKPLRVDQAIPFENDLISFKAFVEIVEQVKKLSNKSSFIERLKSVQYSGWVNYKFCFESNQMPINEEIQRIVKNSFKKSEVEIQYAALLPKKNKFIYVLNDVFEAMDFMGEEKESNDETKLSPTHNFA